MLGVGPGHSRASVVKLAHLHPPEMLGHQHPLEIPCSPTPGVGRLSSGYGCLQKRQLKAPAVKLVSMEASGMGC